MRAVGDVVFDIAVRVAVAVIGISCVALGFGACVGAAVVVCTGVVAAVIVVGTVVVFAFVCVAVIGVVDIAASRSTGIGSRVVVVAFVVGTIAVVLIFSGSWVIVGRFAASSAGCCGQ